MACRALACAAFLLLAADVDASRRRRRRSCSGTTAQNNDNCNSLNAPPPCAPPPPPQYMMQADACSENWEERSRDEDYAGRARTRVVSGQSSWLEVIPADRCVNVPALVEADDNSTSLLCNFAARREANYAASADPEAATIGPPQDGAWGSPSEGCLMPDAGGDDGDYLGYT